MAAQRTNGGMATRSIIAVGLRSEETTRLQPAHVATMRRAGRCRITSMIVGVGLFSTAADAFQLVDPRSSCIARQSTAAARFLSPSRGSLIRAVDPRQGLTPSASQDKPSGDGVADTASEQDDESTDEQGSAATNTINERLMAELQEAKDMETKGARSAVGKKLGLDAFRTEKSEEDRRAAIKEARNLNGVNPLVALGGGVFALAGAAGLWFLTNFVAEYFAMHPIESDIYFVGRVTSVFRNVVIGMVSLASGFFGVTGLGILLLGIRVAYGVMKGDLDPTPIKKSRQETNEMPNVWDLMLNKKPGRRGGNDKKDNNPFGM